MDTLKKIQSNGKRNMKSQFFTFSTFSTTVNTVINVKKILAVINATCAVAKRKPEKIIVTINLIQDNAIYSL